VTDSNYSDNFDRLETELAALARSSTEQDWTLETPPRDLLPSILAEVQAQSAAERLPAAQVPKTRTRWLAAAAALIIVAGGGLAVASGAFDRGGAGTEVASTTLTNEELPIVFDQGGSAVLVDNGGDLVLEVDVPTLPAEAQSFYEVWLIDTKVEGMISLGVLSADGLIDVPDSVVAADFPVVDISVEPLDGDPTHSGRSILRGVLDA